MHILPNRTQNNNIEDDLLKNSINKQEYNDAKHLFRTLRCVRMQEMKESGYPVAPGKSTYKNYATRLLLASTCSPISFFPGYVTAQKNTTANFNAVGIIAGFLPNPDGAIAYHNATKTALSQNEAYAPPQEVLLPAKHKARRDTRNPRHEKSIYMPPAASSVDGINLMLRKIYRRSEHYFGHPDPLLHSLGFYLQYETRYDESPAKYLLRYSGLFGAKWCERLTERHEKKILAAWLSSYVFQGTLEKFIVNEFINISKYKVLRKRVTPRNFESFLTHCIRKILKNSIDFRYLKYYDSSITFIKNNILLSIMPTFLYNNANEIMTAYPMGTIEWGYLHAGLSFAMSAELDLERSSEKDLISLGVVLEAMLREGVINISLVKLFILPAMLYHVKESVDKDVDVRLNEIIGSKEIQQFVLNKYFTACDKFNAINEPIIRLAEALKAYQSRETIETELTSLDCNMEIRPEMPYFQNYRYHFSSTNCADVGKRDNNETRRHPTVDSIIEKQNNDIVNAFYDVNKAIISDAFTGINTDEVGFMAKANIVRLLANFEPTINSKKAEENFFKKYGDLRIRETIELFAAEQNQSRRIYALIKEQGEYRIQRADDHITNYYEFLENYSPLLATDPDVKLSLYKDSRKRLKESHESLDVLALSLSQIHGDKLLIHLNTLNINNSMKEKAEVIFHSLIPFYKCEVSMHLTEENNAHPACHLDIVALARVTGAELDISVLAAAIGGNVSGTAENKVVNGFVARQALKMAIANNPHSMTTLTRMPASETFNGMTISKLAAEFIHAFDSGLGIIGRLSSAILTEVTEGVDMVRRYAPALINLLTMLRAKEIDPYSNPTDALYEMARLPVLGGEVPVARLGGDKFRGKEIYVRINPEDNDIFSRKYTISPNKTLIPVPMPQGRGLKNTRPAGLGWPGAAVDAEKWIAKHAGLLYPRHQSRLKIEYIPMGDKDRITYLNITDESQNIIFSHYSRPDYWQNLFSSYTFDINTCGDRTSEKILFPEMGIPLRHENIDLFEYEKSRHRLTTRLKEAVQNWMVNEDDFRGYKDKSRYIDPSLAQLNSTGLNSKLGIGETLTMEEQGIYDSLVQLTQADIPRHRGSFLRIAEQENANTPWEHSIRVGDIVTNYPQFMVVSADNNIIRDFANQATQYKKLNGVHLKQLIIFRIDNAIRCTPILPIKINRLRPPAEYLYSPHTYFLVKGISIATANPSNISPLVRIGIVLEELADIPYSARNIYTGKMYLHDSPTPL